ncbi:hypothetical protein HMPREF0204_12222 [Chryseobacterium gleum ATCC 35910]|jgi:hypothetical protein|uniref:Uncharacterized protein n=1 Tax=Chryseobacterium gleum ATCC 35910 TaxID=525257 RepID=A0ABN0AJJ6_CHRGE|nr:hypothetical protein HMPREF0204_12222 [Chryseobacterium gleum ATCC 35910]
MTIEKEQAHKTQGKRVTNYIYFQGLKYFCPKDLGVSDKLSELV